ncbi:N-acetylmuramoyl-L-alanine amidase [Nonomuraea spiralis]|uniref:N-acetylmuramoyl-L-alanine amidase n=1 Tax=Nonomuraea spiralis TaxID=46182 RepID=UPI0037A106BB
MQLRLAAVLAASVFTTVGGPAATGVTAVTAVPGVREQGRQADFTAAAAEFGVPVSVLLGVSYLESRWDANGGRPSTAGGYGPMHLVDAVPAGQADGGEGFAPGDARGDDARPMPRRAIRHAAAYRKSAVPESEETLAPAGRLAGLAPRTLRADPRANIRAGAALLASYQRRPSPDPADWYEAVARYSGTRDPLAARAFADEVFAVMGEGMSRRTDDGFDVRLEAVPGLRPPPPAKSGADDDWDDDGDGGWDGDGYDDDDDAFFFPDMETEGDDDSESAAESDWDVPAPEEMPLTAANPQAECPNTLRCEWMPAAYKRYGKKKDHDYGNHDRVEGRRQVDYIVIHDTEGTFQGIPSMVRNPRYVSWHYTIRSRDGHVAQHVPTKDIAWHAGNWDVNARSIGIEHEGYLAKGTWYTEAMYRSSARLVRYLAGRYGIPLDRAHILGHDNVPGATAEAVSGMHEDPGPYWDWAHYFELMRHPIKGDGSGSSVIIRPSYDANQAYFTGCASTKPGRRCPAHGAASVWLRSAPSPTAPLVTDLGKHPGPKPSTYSVYDHSARASTGQRFAVAGREGDWTAIWYLGQRAWFYNPASAPTAVPAKGPLVTPLAAGTRVYGRAYPERSAYQGAAVQPLTPLKYRIGPEQSYSLGGTVTGSYYAANAFNPARHVRVTGSVRYHQIQLGHRIMFVQAKDVRVIR